MASHNRRCNYVELMKIEDKKVKGNHNRRQGVTEYFSNLYREDFELRPKSADVSFDSLDEASRVSPEREFSEEEILKVSCSAGRIKLRDKMVSTWILFTSSGI